MHQHLSLVIKMMTLAIRLSMITWQLPLELATREEINKITEYTFKVNEVLKKFFKEAGIELIDFKIEFGRYHGEVILADEISPDTCRLWDI